MAHKTLIGGTAYNVVGGSTLVGGTQYSIAAGKTLVNGTAYSLSFDAGVPYSLDDWPGWDNADWEDINNLCYAKQQGYIDSWPNDVVVGGTKSVTLTASVSGTTTHNVMIIGMDQDAEGTLTFQTVNSLATASKFSSSSNSTAGSNYYDANNLIFDGNSSGLCKQYYDAFPGKASIMQVNKGTCVTQVSGQNGTATYREQYVWIPSEGEVGLDNYASLKYSNWTTTNGECTYGKKFQYSYYTDNNSRVKKLGDSGSADFWWTRGRYYYFATIGLVCNVNSDGSASSYIYSDSCGVAPAFVIGNPEAQTIE